MARHTAVFGLLVLCSLVVAAGLGLAAVTGAGPADATIETFEPRVAVGNESAGALADSGEVVTCNERGPIPGNAALEGRLEFGRPAGDDGPRDAPFRAVVTVGDDLIAYSLNVTLPPGESTRLFAFATVDRPETLSAGDRVRVRARITTGGATVATAERTVEVAERDRPCEDERDG